MRPEQSGSERHKESPQYLEHLNLTGECAGYETGDNTLAWRIATAGAVGDGHLQDADTTTSLTLQPFCTTTIIRTYPRNHRMPQHGVPAEKEFATNIYKIP
jgi:hypothetical protein